MQTIRLFSDVARCHSFSQAARLHGITQPAASQRIGQLERRLGVTLIDRSIRPLGLTEAGRVFLDGCDDLIHRYDQLQHRISAMRDAPAGTVRVASIYSAGIEMLERIRQRFIQEHPRIHVEITYDAKPDHIRQLLIDGDADLGLVSYPDRFRKMGAVPLRDEVMAVICSPNHALADRTQVTPEDLTPHAMVGFDLDLPVGRRVRQYLRDHDGAPDVTHCFDNLDTLKNAVAATDAFAIVPMRTVLREVAAGTLTTLELTPRLLRPMGAIYRQRGRNGQALSPTTQLFMDALVHWTAPAPGSSPRATAPDPGSLPRATDPANASPNTPLTEATA